jgi:hypothetical protein
MMASTIPPTVAVKPNRRIMARVSGKDAIRSPGPIPSSRIIRPPRLPSKQNPVLHLQAATDWLSVLRIIDQLTVGDPVRLVREPDNPHDPRAVAVYHQDDRNGYVPRERNRAIADRLDQGVPLDCRITAIDPEEGT